MSQQGTVQRALQRMYSVDGGQQFDTTDSNLGYPAE